MSSDSKYCHKVSESLTIENGILKGADKDCTLNYNSFGEMLLERMRSNPTFVGQVDGSTGREETFGEMLDKSVKCALWMREQNIGTGDIVGICTHNQLDMYIPCFASIFVGATYNPWYDIGLTKEMAKYFIELTKPKILFLTESIAEVVSKVLEEIGSEIPIIIFGDSSKYLSLNSILESQDSNEVGKFRCTELPSQDEPLIILYTSGSTGLPKAVLHSHKSIFGNIKHYLNVNEIEKPVVLLFALLSWLTGTYILFLGILMPAKRIIYPQYTPEKCLEMIEKYKVNWILLASSACISLEKCPAISKYDASSLKLLAIGGGAISEETESSLAKLFPTAFVCQCMGITELGGPVIKQERGCKRGSMGRVTENRQLKVVDPTTGKILGPNETGEACFKSPNVMIRYYGNAEATKKAIDSEGWYHSGDLVYYDEDGHVFFADRLVDLIKYRDHLVSPVVIANFLLRHPAVQKVTVVGLPHKADGEHPMAFVEKKPGSQVTEEEILQTVSDGLPDHFKLRGGVKFLDKMPHTSSDKIARKELKALALTFA
ncbi:luciferin 4-monooxygenase-like [Venturia canescens]|uniref:luciferin 4-monooxygenase-like n=1 Tax=Venturia canescens TaxID=32260 RepID=UPI001C9CC07C|nr:luciferin 4-monooxygenase-like [Venturia canescens]